jgi:hypothetical protein
LEFTRAGKAQHAGVSKISLTLLDASDCFVHRPQDSLREQVQTSLKMDFIEDDMEENGWRGGIDVDMERIQEETTEIEVTDASAVYRYPTDGGENVQFILFDLGETEKFTAAQFTAKELDETLNTDPEDSLEEDETADSEQQLDAGQLETNENEKVLYRIRSFDRHCCGVYCYLGDQVAGK